MDRFSKFHPIVGFSFFIGVIAVTLVFINSLCLFISLICAFCYYIRLKGISNALKMVKYACFIIFSAAFFNMLFSHYGTTVLFSVKQYTFTLEPLAAGLLTGVLISAVGMWFFCFNEVISSDKFISLFGALAPNLTLLFSMILRFIPLMISVSNEIRDSQIGLGNEIKGVKNGIKRFSALVSITLEKSIETADTMKARGFGCGERRFYSQYKFGKNDFAAFVLIIVLLCFSVAASIKGAFGFSLEPELTLMNTDFFYAGIFVLFALLPLIIDFAEDIKWRLLRSKI